MVEVKERAKADASPLHFARFEFKYILSAAKRKAVEKDLLIFPPDSKCRSMQFGYESAQ